MIIPDFSQIIFFLGATLLLNITPGADVLYIANRSFGQNKLHGVVAALGISSGLFVHVFLTAFGIGEIFQYSPFAFSVLKIMGAVYLAYLGLKAFLAKGFVLETPSKKLKGSLLKTYLGGILTTLLNPKIIIFFLTFLPQFVDVEKGNAISQLFFLGGVFILSGTIINLFYAFFFSLFKNFILRSKKMGQYLQKSTGVLFTALACKLLLTESR